ncbi:hypothetical protein B0H19DRAFT_1083525 [Mycena capillaripes]|nr:hypothetical protein B0H19DRAFT_1083525 [Mycena capillaripes]
MANAKLKPSRRPLLRNMVLNGRPRMNHTRTKIRLIFFVSQLGAQHSPSHESSHPQDLRSRSWSRVKITRRSCNARSQSILNDYGGGRHPVGALTRANLNQREGALAAIARHPIEQRPHTIVASALRRPPPPRRLSLPAAPVAVFSTRIPHAMRFELTYGPHTALDVLRAYVASTAPYLSRCCATSTHSTLPQRAPSSIPRR